MPTPHVSRDIAAPTEAVWAILTDKTALTGPDTSILRLEGEIAEGNTIKLWSSVNPDRAFAIKVGVMQAPARMEWFSGLPLGLFRGTRTFELERIATGTRFSMTEVYTGPMKGLITRAIPDLQPSFEQFADALKEKAETS